MLCIKINENGFCRNYLLLISLGIQAMLNISRKQNLGYLIKKIIENKGHASLIIVIIIIIIIIIIERKREK